MYFYSFELITVSLKQQYPTTSQPESTTLYFYKWCDYVDVHNQNRSPHGHTDDWSRVKLEKKCRHLIQINHFTDVSVPCTNCEFKMLTIEIEAFCLNLEVITSLENMHFLGIKGISPQHSSIYNRLIRNWRIDWQLHTHICGLFPY